MTTIEVAEAKMRLEELVAKTAAGEEFVLVQAGQPVARLKQPKRKKKWTPPPGKPGERIAGLQPGNILYMADDFDAPLGKEVWGEELRISWMFTPSFGDHSTRSLIGECPGWQATP